MDQLITIGQIDASDTLGSSLHNAAYLGKKKNLKKALDKGIHVDYPNDEGQTPLFTAAYGGHETVVRYLLSAGADANEKTNLGLTAIHAACFSGHLKIVMKLLQAGGDLRLHDYQGRSAKDWAMLNPNPKKRMKILEFLDKTRMFAMSSSGQDLLLNKASSKTLHRAHHRRNTVTNIIRNKIGKPSIHGNLEKMATSQHTLGFGHVYSHGHDTSGFMSAIPFVNENSLKHDQNGETFDNGGFCVMESVWWDYTKVTAKKLRDDIDPYTGGVVDLLINEIEHIGKLRHPNILSLMGVCQASNLDGLYLIYETIPIGSLFNYMHHQLRRLPTEMIQEISLQICDAIIFIHLRGLVHCSITSHAISIIHPHLFKLGNFEYMTEASKCEWGKKNAVANNTAENAVYNWMAPEVMLAMPPSFYCDMYSYCVILWEMFHGDIPWANECAESIKAHYSRGKGLKMMHGKILEYFKIILEYGLQQEPTNRKMTFLHVRDFLMVAPKDAKHYMRTRLKHLHYSDDDTDPSSSRLDTSRQDGMHHSHQSYQQHQGSTSRNIDNAMMKGQMNDRERYGNRRELNRHEYQNRQEINNNHEHHRNHESNTPHKYPTERLHQMKYEQSDDHGFRRNQEHVKPHGHHHKHQHLQSESGRTEMMHRSPERKNYDDRRAATEPRYRNQSGNHSDVRQPTQQLTYGLDGLKWGNFPQDVGEEFIYTVQVKKEESPKKASAPFLSTSSDENTLAAPRGRAATKYLVFTDSETSQDTSSQTEYTTEPTTSESSQHARGRSLERKTSSMGNFSFLSLNNHQRTRSAGAKPANHGHYELVAEEYTTQGKLTTAGSLYSLYNDHSPDKPLGQIEDRQKYSTFPRRAFTFSNTETEATEEGISKSVRDLAKLFQQQIAEHSHNQAVLDGTVNREHSTEKLDQSKSNKSTPHKDKSNNKDIGNHACTPKKVSVMKELVDSHPSSETSKLATADNSISESDSTCTFSTNGSSDSECISQWVDYELHKIKRKLSQEMMMKQKSPVQVQSPVLFDSPDDTTSKVTRQIDNKQANRLYFSDSEGSDTNTAVKDTHQCKGDHNEDNTEECFFDDELYLGTSNSDLDIRSRDVGQTMSGSISNLPMTSIMKKTESPSKPTKSVARSNTSDQSKKKIRRIPRRVPHSCSQLMSEPRRDEGTYANVMTIRSSIDEVGKHHVTHKIKNLKTGGSSTLLNERVTGNRVVTVFKA